MARELSVIFKKPLKKIDPLLKFKAKVPAKGSLKITIKDADICPRFSGCIISGVKIADSPQWVKSHLQAAGIRPINNVVDVTNYVMLELGQPMHAYDRALVGDTLKVRYAKKGELLETIDHKNRPLHEQDPVVTNAKGPLGVAGIMGGADSEISNKTTDVILEAANWNPKIIRKCSMRHGLRSEASQRFEKGLDPHLTELALRRAIVILEETCPNLRLESPLATVGHWKPSTLKIKFRPESARCKIGLNLPNAEMTRILKALEFKITPDSSGYHEVWEVVVPSHRATGDVKIEDDLVEEVARIYGYNEIPEQLPQLPIRLPLENDERIHKHDARRILAHQLGFTETLNYSFYSVEDFTKCGLQEMGHIRVKNALSGEQTHMRTNLIPGLLNNIRKNAKRAPHLKLFEIGRTYLEIGEFMPSEEKWIATATATQEKTEAFYEMKGALETFLKDFGSPQTLLRDCTTPPPYAHPRKCIEIVINGQTAGYGFEVHPAIAKNFELEHKTACFELNFTRLVQCGRTLATFEELPRFPSIFFDVSLLIDRRKPAADVKNAIRKTESAGLLRTIKLFDIYEGKNIPEDKKSLAFTIELRHDDRTLSDREFQKTQAAVFAAIEKMGGQVRKG
jgi:phenylalanyl-tRNA synthetase beta chain